MSVDVSFRDNYESFRFRISMLSVTIKVGAVEKLDALRFKVKVVIK